MCFCLPQISVDRGAIRKFPLRLDGLLRLINVVDSHADKRTKSQSTTQESADMFTRILKALDRLEDSIFADLLGIIFLAAIVPCVFFLGEVLK